MTPKKIYIVTGATGFVGNVLVKKLVADGKTVHALVRSETKAELVLNKVDCKLFYGDVCDTDSIEKLFCVNGAEYVVMHTAAIVLIHGNRHQYKDMRKVNLQGTQNIIDACLKHNAKLVHVSSVHAITEPPNRELTTETDLFDPKTVHGPYAKSKSGATALVLDAVKNSGLNAVVVHPGGIMGPYDYGDSHLTQLVTDYLDGRIPASVNGGYDFVDVRDVVDGIIASENATSGSCYLLTNRYYKITEVMNHLYDLTGYKKISKTLPMWLAKVGMPFLWAIAKIKKNRPLYTSYSLYTLNSNSNYSHQKATDELNYNPRELRESLKDTLDFLVTIRPEYVAKINPVDTAPPPPNCDLQMTNDEFTTDSSSDSDNQQ